MIRHYSTRDFFRHMPNALLARYFQEQGLFCDFDFAAMKEAKPDLLFAKWQSLPDGQRNRIDAELCEISDMSSEKGFLAIIDEANWQYRDSPEQIPGFVAKLSALGSHHERAMVTFLDHRNFWKAATHFHHADTLIYWRKRKNFPSRSAATDPDSLKRLARSISEYFSQEEGRGRNCVVETFRRGNRDYYFAYPEDHSQRSIEWVDGEFHPRPHNPAFEVVFVYMQKGRMARHELPWFKQSYRATVRHVCRSDTQGGGIAGQTQRTKSLRP